MDENCYLRIPHLPTPAGFLIRFALGYRTYPHTCCNHQAMILTPLSHLSALVHTRSRVASLAVFAPFGRPHYGFSVMPVLCPGRRTPHRFAARAAASARSAPLHSCTLRTRTSFAALFLDKRKWFTYTTFVRYNPHLPLHCPLGLLTTPARYHTTTIPARLPFTTHYIAVLPAACHNIRIHTD